MCWIIENEKTFISAIPVDRRNGIGEEKDIFCIIWFPLVVCIDKRKGRDNILYNFIKINLYLKKNAKYMGE